MDAPFRFQPVVIIGAARSGTNMLRDALCRLEGVATWPCDEINPIWRHGNLDVPHDEFTRAHARPRIASFVRARFAAQARSTGARFLVEKTCANAMRVGFVHEVVPEARFIHIHRDGMDAVPSAMKRWRAPFELGYTLRKVRWVPTIDLPHYLLRFAANRVHRLRDREKRLASWGPRFEGLGGLPADTPLVELCSRQWARSVESARAQLPEIPAAQRIELAYEDFVADPRAGLRHIADWLDGGWDDGELAAAVADVRQGSVGRGARALSTEEQETVRRYASAVANSAAGG